MKKNLWAGFVLIALLSLSGCKVDTELWIDNKGGGNGNVTVIGAPMVSADELKSRLEKSGVTVVSIDQQALGNMIAKIRWTDFNEGIGKRQALDNGYVLLDFGKVEMGTITAHVDGKIVSEKTTGKMRDATTVIFQGGRARLVYLPNKAASFPIYALVAGGFIVIIGIIVFMKVRGEGEARQQVDSKTTLPAVEESPSKSPDAKFCTNCGAERSEEHPFCTKCGNKFL